MNEATELEMLRNRLRDLEMAAAFASGVIRVVSDDVRANYDEGPADRLIEVVNRLDKATGQCENV